MSIKSKSDTRWDEFLGDIYPVKVMFFIGSRKEMVESFAEALARSTGKEFETTRKEFVEKVRSQFSTEISGVTGECICVTASSGTNVWIVRVRNFVGSIDDMVTLSHECLHAALSVLGFCGVSENPPFEVLCYTHEAIFKKFLVRALSRKGLLKDPPSKKLGGGGRKGKRERSKLS